mmetsp:Transcript_31145/g.67363  ORF Transcript_31145/g.67363 Transcript_31145/m.67363 type:complete len:274 (-) Transcript_31145:49-870(-)
MFVKGSPAISAFTLPTPARCRVATQPSGICRSASNARLMAIDGNSIILALDPSFADQSASPAALTSSGITPIQEFEPVLNTEAAASFVIIAIVFTLLQLRINAVSDAAKRRSFALEALRQAESLQLASDQPTEDQVTRAKKKYENALREEMDLRTIVPGVRIVAPNDPKRDEEERAAAKRFLGWGSDEFGDDGEGEGGGDIINNNLGEENINGDIQREGSSGGLSNSANFLLFGVASMLIVLLWTLSFDPMVADQVFTTMGGSPPSDMPLSSW